MARSKSVGYRDPYQVTAADLRHQVCIMKRLTQRDEGGGRTQKWVPVDQVPMMFADLRPASARETFVAAQAGQSITHIVRMRYRRDVSVDNSLKYNGRVFSIATCINVGERNRMLELRCEERFELDERGNL